MNAIAEVVNNAEPLTSDLDAVVRAGIESGKAGDLQAALSPEVLAAMASLKQSRGTLGQYLALLAELVSSHKSIRKGDTEKAINELLPEDEKQSDGRVNAADEIVALVLNACDLFTDQDDNAHALLSQESHREVWPVDSKTFEDWVSRLIYKTTGKTTRKASQTDAFSTLNGIARHDGETRDVFLKVACDGAGGYYIDMGDQLWRVLHVTSHGWQVINESPVLFRRSKSTKPLPEPQAGGSLKDLKKLVNVSEADDLLLVTALIDFMRPDTAYPVVELIGEQGSGKSTTAEYMRRLIDPKSVNLRSAPKAIEDLFVSARNNHCVCLNNLSHLSGGEQDALCNLSTGGGYASRKLYSDNEENTYEAKRPVLLNGINPVATQSDLVSRVVRLECPPLGESGKDERIEDAELAQIFDIHAPLALGFLLDTMASALALLPDVTLTDKPRLMDFAKLGAAVGEVMHPDSGQQAFTERYTTARMAASMQALDSMPVIVSLLDYLEVNPSYVGTYGELLSAIDDVAGKNRDTGWPKSAKGLSNAINRAKPVLTLLGWRVAKAARSSRGEQVSITKKPVSVKENNPDSNYTKCTTCTGTAESVLSVGSAGDSGLITSDSKEKTHSPPEAPATTGTEGFF